MTIPFYLGTAFSIDAAAEASFITGFPGFYDGSGSGYGAISFSLQEADGTPVSSMLAPEPSTSAVSGLFETPGLYLLRKRRKRQAAAVL